MILKRDYVAEPWFSVINDHFDDLFAGSGRDIMTPQYERFADTVAQARWKLC